MVDFTHIRKTVLINYLFFSQKYILFTMAYIKIKIIKLNWIRLETPGFIGSIILKCILVIHIIIYYIPVIFIFKWSRFNILFYFFTSIILVTIQISIKIINLYETVRCTILNLSSTI